jgi:hypothetical protein
MRKLAGRMALVLGLGAALAACGATGELTGKKAKTADDTDDAPTVDSTDELVDATDADDGEALGLGKAPVVQKPTGPWTLSLKGIHGPGCPAGSVATNVSPDQEAFTLIFSNMAVSVDAGAKARKASTRCDVDLGLTMPSGWQAAVLGVDYRGYASLDAGVKATLKTSYLYASPKKSPTHTINARIAAPHDGDFLIHHNVVAANMVWTPCTLNAVMRLSLTAAIEAPKKKAAGFLQVDSQDGELRQKMGIAFKPCKR